MQPPWLGVSVADVDQLLAEQLELPLDEGVYVTGVVADGPAAEAGIVPSAIDFHLDRDITVDGELGDLIVEVDSVPVGSVKDLITEINHHQPGDRITLTIIRDGKETEVLATLGRWPEESKANITRRFFHRGLPEHPDSSIFPDFPREFRVPQYHHDFSIPRFSIPDLVPEFPHR